MNSIQDLKLGTLQGVPAVIVLGAIALTVLIVLIVILINGIRAAMEHKNALEDKAENEFFAEYGITGAEMRLNERITAMQEQLTERKRLKKKNRTAVETQFVVVERAGEPVPTVVHSEEYADVAPLPEVLTDANAQEMVGRVYDYDENKEYEMPFSQYDEELVYDMPKSVYSYDDNLVYPMPPRENVYDDDYIYTIDNPVYEDIELAAMPDMINESDEPEMVEMMSLDEEAQYNENGERLVDNVFEKPAPAPTYDGDILPPRPEEPAKEAAANAQKDETQATEAAANEPATAAEQPVAKTAVDTQQIVYNTENTAPAAQDAEAAEAEEAIREAEASADEDIASAEDEAYDAIAEAHAAADEAVAARRMVMEAVDQLPDEVQQATEAASRSDEEGVEESYVAPIDQVVDEVTENGMFDELFAMLGLPDEAKSDFDADECLPVTIIENAEEPVAEEVPTEESVAEEPVAEEPVEEVATEEVAEEPVAEEAPAEEPVAEETPAEEAVAEEPAEEVAAEEVAEEPVAEKKVVKLIAPFMPMDTPKNERKEPQKPVSFDDSTIYGKYVIEHAVKEDGNNEYFFTLYGAGGKVLYESGNYSSLEFCQDAIKRFRAHVYHGVFTIDNADGRFFYVLKYKGFTYKGAPTAAFDEVTSLVKQVKHYFGTFVVREQ